MTKKRPMTPDTVLFVTASYDLAPDYVGASLQRYGVPYFRLDTDRFPFEVQAEFSPSTGIKIRDGDRTIQGAEIKSVWYRRNVAPFFPAVLDAGLQDFCERENRAFLEGTLWSLPTNRWLSSPSAIWKAERKPYQLSVAHHLGFSIPRTVITNDEAVVHNFSQGHQLVGKAVSSGYISTEEGNKGIFTSEISSKDLEDLNGLALAPVTFQDKVEKTSDIRVTVVGEDVFAVEILSQGRATSRVDWRATDDPDLQHRIHELPQSLIDRCRTLVAHFGLDFGAIDFALTPKGDYIFFEINPNGEWVWLEEQLGLPISDKIARWLIS